MPLLSSGDGGERSTTGRVTRSGGGGGLASTLKSSAGGGAATKQSFWTVIDKSYKALYKRILGWAHTKFKINGKKLLPHDAVIWKFMVSLVWHQHHDLGVGLLDGTVTYMTC